MANEIVYEGKYLMYKDRPLVRENNLICYGDMKDKYVLFLMILGNKKIDTADPNIKLEVPENIVGQILSTDSSKPVSERLVEQFAKKSLYEALDFGIIRLDRHNKK